MLASMLFKRHLEEDETIVRLVHKHWLIGLKTLFWPTVFFLVTAFVLSIRPSRGIVAVIALTDVVILVWWLRNFFDYYLDAWLVTDQGVIDVAWHGWFHRESSRVLYSDVQGVSYEINGVLPTLLRYGTISVEKVSNGSTISLDCVKRPRRVEATILKCMEAYLHAKNLKDAAQVQTLLSTIVARHMQVEELAVAHDDDD